MNAYQMRLTARSIDDVIDVIGQDQDWEARAILNILLSIRDQLDKRAAEEEVGK